VNGVRLALQNLPPEAAAAEIEADTLLAAFEQDHDGVHVLRPHHSSEPWRAEIREGAVPGEGRTTSGFLVADWPSGLLTKLRAAFGVPGADTG
jgi:hypothetical protein